MEKSFKNHFLMMLIFGVLSTMTISSNESAVSNTNSIPEVQYANITNAKIAYKIFGSGEPLIMCIGYSNNMDFWSTKAIDILSKKFKVIVFDYRGMGLSTNSENSFTIQTLANDLNELLLELKISKTHVIGWSMGGFVAQMFALNFSEKVNKLVLIATHCGDIHTISPSDDVLKILTNPKASPMEMLSILFSDDWLAENKEPWKVLPKLTEPINGKTIGLQYQATEKWLSPNGGSYGHLNKLKMPVLILFGKEDKVVPFKNSEIFADSIKSSVLIGIPNAGHGMMFQIPEVFSESIINFLK
jgi:pimeloyl-ACP methyl ester carboxylesterase